MQMRRIERLVNALYTQQRMILHLECRHNISLTATDLEANPKTLEWLMKREPGATWNCHYCPDPPQPSVEELRAAQHPIRLWKEAGEP